MYFRRGQVSRLAQGQAPPHAPLSILGAMTSCVD